MHPDQHVAAVGVGAGDVAAHQRDVFDLVVDALVADGTERAVAGGDSRVGDADDVLLVLTAPRDQIGDRDQCEVVFVGEHPQLVGLRHRSLVLLADDLADDSGGAEVGHAGEVHGRLGVPGATQYAAFLGAQRDDMAGAGEVVRTGVGVREQAHRGCSVGGGDTGSDTFSRVDGDGVRRSVFVLVGREHRRQAESVAILTGQRDTEVARGIADHEGNQFRGGLLGGEDEVAFVLAVLVVDDHHCFARSDVRNCALDTVEPGHESALHRSRAWLSALEMSPMHRYLRALQQYLLCVDRLQPLHVLGDDVDFEVDR
ncbi:unannotated protein [freshwater metagenome]|uniref:Unannotated protein n=1 Tax=freshwater metagenome TaxID=449393 RepID=A0A6J7GH60_9ZZZZ